MFALSPKNQWFVAGGLLLTMLATRGHVVDHLQDASWAVFFLLGFYVRFAMAYPLFWLAAFAIDYTVTSNGSVSSYCMTPAYGFTFVAYAALWAAGRWSAHHYRYDWHGAARLVGAVLVGTLVCFAISNVSFYALAGYFEKMTAQEYALSVLKYLPAYLQTTVFYVGIAALVHVGVQQTRGAKEDATL